MFAADLEFDLDRGGVRDRERENERGLLLPTFPGLVFLSDDNDGGGGVLGEEPASCGRSDDAACVDDVDSLVGDLVEETMIG